MSSNKKLVKWVLSAMFLALAMILPFVTGQIPTIGSALCPMHFPVILAGFFVGPLYGCMIGAIAPLLRFVLFGMPPLMPTGIAMCFELAIYGLCAGLMYHLLPKKNIYIYISLIISMISGRVVWGIVRAILFGFGVGQFGFNAFMAGAFLNAIPGIITQIIIIPVLVIAFKKYTVK